MRGTVTAIAAGLIFVSLTAPGALAFAPALEVAHEYGGHDAEIRDVEYDAASGVVWSLDKSGGLVGYDVAEGSTVVTESFEQGHALALGPGLVFVASGSTLWAYEIDSGERVEAAQLQDHVAGLAYDEEREVVWTAGHETVYGHDVHDGSVVASHEEHTDGMSSIAVHGDYVASGTSWQDEVVVWDIESEEVAWQPEFPEDVGKIGAVGFTQDGRLLVGTDAEDGSLVGLYDVEAQATEVEYREHVFSVSGVAYDASADVIVSTGFDNTVKFYDVAEDALAAEYEHGDTIYTADLDAGNDLLWFGDGEDGPGTVTGLDVSAQEPEGGDGDPAGDDGASGAADEEDGGTDEPDSGDAAGGNESPLGLGSLVAGLGAALVAARRSSKR